MDRLAQAHAIAAALRPLAKRCTTAIRYLPTWNRLRRSGKICYAPFDCGLGIIRDSRRALLYTRDISEPPGLIHELGHLLFDPPFGAMGREYRWFGWEWQVANRIGVEEEWREFQQDYGVSLDGDTMEFGCLTRNEQNRLIAERLDEAGSFGYLNYLPEGTTP